MSVDAKTLKFKLEAEHKARLLAADLLIGSRGDNALLLQGLAVAMETFKNEVVALLAVLDAEKKASAGASTDGVRGSGGDGTAWVKSV